VSCEVFLAAWAFLLVRACKCKSACTGARATEYLHNNNYFIYIQIQPLYAVRVSCAITSSNGTLSLSLA